MTLRRAGEIAAAVRAGRVQARDLAEATLAVIDALNPGINAFTTVTRARARADAARVDACVAAGRDPGPLAGVPFAVKDLFDIEGVTTLAGSKILAERTPAARDAAVVRRLCTAGGVLVGGLNMEEFAYGFLTDNAHYGRTLNPLDRTRTAGGSSGGSGAAVAAEMVPIALGTDTSGSTRVPAAFCGIVGLKPTYGRLSTDGMVPFCPSLDHVGLLGGTVADVALAWQALGGDAAAAADAPRIGLAGGYYAEGMNGRMREAMRIAARLMRADTVLALPAPDAARAAAYVMLSAEGSSLRLADLRTRPADFDPATRHRFLAGALLPAEWYIKAQRFRAWYRDRAKELFARVDVILAPAVPFEAPRFGEETVAVEGKILSTRATIGRFTQPLSPLGLPIVAVPIRPDGGMPLGLQLIGAPHSEELLLRVAQRLEQALVAEGLSRKPTRS